MSDRITTRFNKESTASEVLDGVDLSGRCAVVTGASSGVGVSVAEALARAGSKVVLAARRHDEMDAIAERIRSTTGNHDIAAASLDLSDRASIARFVQEWNGPLDMLVNNAGIIIPKLERTVEGWERQFAVNYLGHFSLTLGLRDALTAAAAARGEARVVTTGSSGNLRSPVVFDDLHFRYRPYTDTIAYGQSKTATILFAVALADRWADLGITANSVTPGSVNTSLIRDIDPVRRRSNLGDAMPGDGTVPPGWKTEAQGAATTALAAASPLLRGIAGHYFEDCHEAEVVHDNNGYRWGVAPYALDPGNAQRLWDESLELVGLP